jgi:hypothetical protein
MMKAIAATTILVGLAATNAHAREVYRVYDLTKVKPRTVNPTGLRPHTEFRLNQRIKLRPGQRVGFFLPGGDKIRVTSGLHAISAKDGGVTVRQILRGPMAGKQLVILELRGPNEATDHGRRMAQEKGFGVRFAPRLDHVLGSYYDRPGQRPPRSWYASIDLPGAPARATATATRPR